MTAQVAALENRDFEGFLKLVKESGHSSWMYLQNVIPAGYTEHQDMAVALGLCEHYLQGKAQGQGTRVGIIKEAAPSRDSRM